MTDQGPIPEGDRPEGDRIAALVDEVARLGRRVGELASQVGSVDELRGQVATLAEIVGALADQPDVGGHVWLTDLDGEERYNALRGLGAWVDDVLRTHHPESYKSLASCWYRHVDVLDELAALRDAWYGAYRDPTASVTAAIEWHDRWLPGTVERCRKAIKARPCEHGKHEEPPKTEPVYDSVEFERFAKGAD